MTTTAPDPTPTVTTEIPMIVSVDDHVVEPPHLWQTWLPAKFKERGPRIERFQQRVAGLQLAVGPAPRKLEGRHPEVVVVRIAKHLEPVVGSPQNSRSLSRQLHHVVNRVGQGHIRQNARLLSQSITNRRTQRGEAA